MSDALNADVFPQRTLAGKTFDWLQRVIAAYCLVFGVIYWSRIIGFHEGAVPRFDLMPVHWQVASVTLAAFFPFAAIGLWMLASWGPVIWVICAASEIVMFAGYPDLFGENRLAVASHLGTLALYAAFRLVLAWQKRRAAVSGY